MSFKKPLHIFTAIVFLFLFSIFLCGCINNKILVSAERNSSIAFEKYKKYTFVDFFMPKNPGEKFCMYNGFKNKDYALEIVEQKLTNMGFVRDDEDPDFAVWVGYSMEFADFSGKNNADDLAMISTSGKYLSYASDSSANELFKGHIKTLGIYFFYVGDVPRNASIKNLCALSELAAKAKTFKRDLNREELIKILKELVKLSTTYEFFELDIETLRKDVDSKFPCTTERLVWTGFVGYFSAAPYLEEKRVPILIDVLLDSYPTEHIPMVSDRSIGDTPE